jgi:hypothetical protein
LRTIQFSPTSLKDDPKSLAGRFETAYALHKSGALEKSGMHLYVKNTDVDAIHIGEHRGTPDMIFRFEADAYTESLLNKAYNGGLGPEISNRVYKIEYFKSGVYNAYLQLAYNPTPGKEYTEIKIGGYNKESDAIEKMLKELREYPLVLIEAHKKIEG